VFSFIPQIALQTLIAVDICERAPNHIRMRHALGGFAPLNLQEIWQASINRYTDIDLISFLRLRYVQQERQYITTFVWFDGTQQENHMNSQAEVGISTKNFFGRGDDFVLVELFYIGATKDYDQDRKLKRKIISVLVFRWSTLKIGNYLLPQLRKLHMELSFLHQFPL
ncbi:hypothetical protein ACJX0J_006271, partial [Zea mays]